jgi:hypothetical protein
MAPLQSSATLSEDVHLGNALLRHLENPFLVLSVPVAASLGDIERQGQKLLAMLAAGLAEANLYTTPFETRARTPELVRAAMCELRNPERRLLHEFWAAGWGKGP